MTKADKRRWATDTALGAIGGGIAGAIIAVNVMIYAGPDDGYESSIGDVFRHSPVAGSLTIASIVIGPVAGILVARRLRSQRSDEA